MRKTIMLAVSLLTFNTICLAQDQTNSIDSQFTTLVNESNNYQTYKIVPKVKLQQLQTNVNNAMNKLQSVIDNHSAATQAQTDSLISMSNKLETAQADLAVALERENSFQVLGMSTQKSTFTSIVWTIIGILILALAFFVFRFKKSHAVTREANLRLAETEQELEDLRKSSLEREQKIRRQLQDEINKHKKTV
ncbi:LPXTG cell wall anchor domain-containing protein [Myroides phaeus]|uniref:LPXTG cell wall anchor domain-containing protein n=1 Tax=Myroides phaeus TaxID=702745 RepID=UPI00130349C9|nr:LPXTG cell wall anchor domain-containing protein [Myroides phaeus]